tara:strand:- start:260 stop:1060 length:801 start_codon:yes stop_codon:yes gene_type:complete
MGIGFTKEDLQKHYDNKVKCNCTMLVKGELKEAHSYYENTMRKRGYYIVINEACYAYTSYFKSITQLKFLLPTLRPKNVSPLVDYIINRSLFKTAFKTKSAESALKKGVFIDCRQKPDFVRAAMISLRSPFEEPDIAESYNRLRGLGISEHISFYIAYTTYTKDGIHTSSLIHSRTIDGRLNPQQMIKFNYLGSHKDPMSKDSVFVRAIYSVQDSYNKVNYISPLLLKLGGKSTKDVFGYTTIKVTSSDKNLIKLAQLFSKEYGID